MSRLRTLARFLLAGALLFGADRWIGATFPSERGALHGAAISDDEILFREALALGMQHDDAVVAQRLVRNLRFLGAPPESSDTGLLREALALKLERSDPVVRRRLIQRMRLALAERVRADGVPDGELHALRERDAARLTQPARVHLRHVYFSRERRGDARHADAAQLATRLSAEPDDFSRQVAQGDAFLLGHELRSVSEAELARALGETFARAVFALEPGCWSGPFESAYGSHLVRVESVEPERPLSFASALPQLRSSWLAERERSALREELARLRASRTRQRSGGG